MVASLESIIKALYSRYNDLSKDVLVVVLVTFLLRLPSLFEPPWYDDEGIYAAVANSLLNGQRLYTEVIDNRPPGIYLLYALIMGVFGPNLLFIKLAAISSVIGSQLIVVRIGSHLWSRRAGTIAALLLGILSSAPLFEGNIANAEIFMIFPTCLGMLLWIKGRYFYAGIAFGAALSLKQIAGAEFMAAIIAALLFAPYWRRRAALLLAGYSIPVLLILAYVVISGSFGEFIYANFSYYTDYLQRGARVHPSFLVVKVLLLPSSILLMMAWARGPRSEKSANVALITLWLVFALFGAIFTGRPYPHYLLPSFPSLSLLIAGCVVSRQTTSVTRVTWPRLLATSSVLGISVWLLVSIFVPWSAWASPSRTVGYYRNFAEFVLGIKSRVSYNDFFDKRVNRNLEVASYLASRARDGDSLLVWGDEPWIYALSSLPDVARVTVAYYAYEIPGELKRVAESVAIREPAFIALVTSKPVYPELKKAIEKNYVVSKTVGTITVMERTPPLIVQHGDVLPGQFIP